MKNNIYIADVCGLCYGSKRAIDSTLNALNDHKNVTLYKEILHNKNVMDRLKERGALVKDNLNDITCDDYVIVRAHGEPYNTFKAFDNRGISYIDCTCPNVKAINLLVKLKSEEGYKIIIIGKYGFKNNIMHPEVNGIAGWCTTSPILIEDESEIERLDLSFDKYFLVVQTTFSKDKALNFIDKINNLIIENKKEFKYRNTICNAQKNINDSACNLAKKVDVMLVMGGKNSSNSKELFNNISKIKTTYFIENIEEVISLIHAKKLNSNQNIGITAGASTMNEDIESLKSLIHEYLSNV